MLVLALTGVVGSRLRWSVSPNFLWYEVVDVANSQLMPLSEWCSPHWLAGLDGPTANLSPYHMTSPLYSVATRALRQWIYIPTIHRVLHVLYYAVGLGLLTWALVRWCVDPFVIAVGVTYYGLSAQYIAPVFDALLAVTVPVWIGVVAAHLSALTDAKRWRVVPVLLGPIVAASAYEVYAIARPLAPVYAATVLGWAAYHYTWKGVAAWLCGCAVAYLTLVTLHPLMRFDASILRGDKVNETVIDNTNALRPQVRAMVWERVRELPALLAWPRAGFRSREVGESGWRTVWLTLIVLAILSCVLWRWAQPEGVRLAVPLVSLSMLGLTALVVPFASTQYIRGWRFSSLYAVSILLAALGAQVVVSALPRVGRMLVRGMCLCAVCGLLWVRVPEVRAWSSGHAETEVPGLIQQLRTMMPPVPVPQDVALRIQDWLSLSTDMWYGALIASDFACRFHVTQLLDSAAEVPCPLVDSVHPLARILMARGQHDGDHSLVIQFCGASQKEDR
jgi:hypothetical protein